MIGEWLDIGWVNEIPVRGSRTVTVDGAGEIAVFRTGDDKVFALRNRCPHKGGPLCDGITSGTTVVCPLHGQRFDLESGAPVLASQPDCLATFPTRVEDGVILVDLSRGEKIT